jgi:hypothetical protein
MKMKIRLTRGNLFIMNKNIAHYRIISAGYGSLFRNQAEGAFLLVSKRFRHARCLDMQTGGEG